MKSGKPHAIPLSDLALEVFERQASVRRSDSDSDAVFPGLSYGVFSAAVRALPFDVGTPHSWRSIFRDTVQDTLGFPPHLAEAALAHSLGKVTAAYRRETGIEARRPVMEAYSRWLMSEGADVVAFGAVGSRRP
jgi:integrase